MINVLIPMAGLGLRFREAGYALPKPFIDVNGAPMIRRVIENINLGADARIILVAQRQHALEYSPMFEKLEEQFPLTKVLIDGVTEGAACTCLLAHRLINNDDPLLIANSDQIVDVSFKAFVERGLADSSDGAIMTFEDKTRDKKWSYVEIGSDGWVKRAREKEPISNEATVGVYLFRRGRGFVENALDMILKQDRVNGEYYTCPVYNYLVSRGGRVRAVRIAQAQMHGLGTPRDLEFYLGAHP